MNAVTDDLKFLSEGWRNIAELNATKNALVHSYVWSSHLSETLDGGSGLGGLLLNGTFPSAIIYYAFAYAEKGNLTRVVSMSGGTKWALYEYSPSGEPLCATGGLAKPNPLRFTNRYDGGQPCIGVGDTASP